MPTSESVGRQRAFQRGFGSGRVPTSPAPQLLYTPIRLPAGWVNCQAEPMAFSSCFSTVAAARVTHTLRACAIEAARQQIRIAHLLNFRDSICWSNQIHSGRA